LLLPSPLEPALKPLFLQPSVPSALPVDDFELEALDESVSKLFTKSFMP